MFQHSVQSTSSDVTSNRLVVSFLIEIKSTFGDMILVKTVPLKRYHKLDYPARKYGVSALRLSDFVFFA
jgi:hypothetical protein